MKLKFFIIIFLLLLTSNTMQAQTGQREFLDTTFNKTGPLTRGIKYLNLSGAETRAIAVDAKGKIVTVVSFPNSTNFYLFRLKPDGSADSPFGGNKGDSAIIASPTIQKVNSLIIQPDGKILVAGYRKSTKGDADMMVMRFNYNGTRDSAFGKAGIWLKDFNQQSDSVCKIALQTNGNIIVAGSRDTIVAAGIPPYRLSTILCLRPDGQGEVSSFQRFMSTSGFYNENLRGLSLFNDTIYVGTNSYNYDGTTQTYYNYKSIIKLLPNGKLGWADPGRYSTSSDPASLVDLEVRQDGDIFFAGNDALYFALTRMKSNGQFTGTAHFTQRAFTFKDMLIDKDGKIILSGQDASGICSFIKTDGAGKLDSTFGTNGFMYQIGASNGYKTLNQCTFSIDRQLLFVGQDLKSPFPFITKVYIKPILNIIGASFVLPNTPEAYTAKVPGSLTNLTYTWSYTGKNIYYFSSTGGAAISIFFTDSATSGILTCKAFSGSTLVSYEEKFIKVNSKTTEAYQLARPACLETTSDCNIGYIDNFSFSSIENKASGCSPTGYVDYTKSRFADTLAAGGAYSARLLIPNEGVNFNYVGIWIDYNNDGEFNSSDEFVGEGYSSSNEVLVNNIVLKNEPGYTGPKRLRVRSQPDTSFVASQSCPSVGDAGETEDYLVVISTQTIMEGPQIITPNDDGKNDFFVIRGVDPVKNNKLTIFDRIGTLKFSSSDYKNNWSGTSDDGTLLIPGTYFYVFTSDKNSIKGFLEIRY